MADGRDGKASVHRSGLWDVRRAKRAKTWETTPTFPAIMTIR